MDGVGGYTCDCTGTGYEGRQCQSNVDDCSPNPCQHGGVCTDGVRSYTCNCSGTGYQGTTCTTDIDECALGTDNCDDDPEATCTNTTGGFTCTCPGGTTDLYGDGTECVAAGITLVGSTMDTRPSALDNDSRSYTISDTLDSAMTDESGRLLLVAIEAFGNDEASRVPTNVAYDSQGMTYLTTHQAGNAAISFWYLQDSALLGTPGAYNLTYEYTGHYANNQGWVIDIVQWKGVNQATPFVDTQTDTGGNCCCEPNWPLITVTSGANDWWTYEMIALAVGSDISQLTPDSGQTVTGFATENNARAVGATLGEIAAAGTQDLTWTGWSSAGCNEAATVAVALQP